MSTSKGDFLKNRALPAAGARFFKIRGATLGAKIDQKSIKKWSPRWSASWHRFLIDFGGFLEASWDGKSIKNRSKKASKNRCQKEGDKIGKNRHLEAS